MHESSLTQKQREEVVDAIGKVVAEKFCGPDLMELEWEAVLTTRRPTIVAAPTDEAFERGVGELLQELKSSHVGFYHTGLRRCTGKMVLGATYAEFIEGQNPKWVFQDVHEGGPAAKAGIKSGDVLLAVAGVSFQPPDHPLFAMGSTAAITVQRGERKFPVLVSIPMVKVKRNQLPKIEPNPIVSRQIIDAETGYVKIASYPGMVGIDVARDISEAVAALGPIKRLIFDLRGNPGGGIGVLRVMSLLTPDRRVVGVFLKGSLKNVTQIPEGGFVFDKIPSGKLTSLSLAARFFAKQCFAKLTKKKMPIVVMTEGCGGRDFHSKVVLLVNRHTASANEMLLKFAREHKLAVIVGEATPGRVRGGSKFFLPHGYWLALPVGAFQTSDGDSIEGNPIAPDVESLYRPEEARAGSDTQLEMAIKTVSQL